MKREQHRRVGEVRDQGSRKRADGEVAPLPVRRHNDLLATQIHRLKKGDKVAVAGFGDLGHMALHYAVALGAEVTVFDITENKRQDALPASRAAAIRSRVLPMPFLGVGPHSAKVSSHE